MGTLLDDAALVHHQDLVRAPHRLEPVGDHQHGLLPRQGFHSPLELILILGVHIGRGLIEDDDGRVLQETPGDGDALLLSAGERGSSLANYRIISIRQGGDKVVAARLFSGLHHLLMGSARAAELDVVLHRVGKEVHPLEHHAHLFHEGLQGVLPHIPAADGHTAAVHIPKPGDQVAESGLAGAGRSHNGGGGPVRDDQ